MGSNDKNFSSAGYEPKDYFLTETYVEFNQESMTEQRFPEQRFPEDVDYDDAAIGEMLFNAYREQVYHSQRESLSSGQSSSSMSERTGQAVVDTGQEQNLEHAQTRTLLDRQKKRKSSPTVRRRLENTNSSLIMTEEVYKIKWNDRAAARRTSSCPSWRTTSTRSSTSSWKVTEAKLGSSWSSWEKSQWNGRIEAISGFYSRHNCKKKIGRRPRYCPWIHWQDTGIAKWN